MTSRRLTLLDAMVLIAALAVGLVLSRPLTSQTDFSGNSWLTPASRAVLKTWWCLQVTLPVPASLTLSVLALRLLRPGPGLRRLARQPGAVAGLAWSVVVAIKAIGFLASTIRTASAAPLMILEGGWDDDTQWTIALSRLPAHQARGYIVGVLAETSVQCGLAVAAAWLLLALGGRWRPEASWIDRAGRAFGAYWVCLALLGCWWDPRILL